VVAAEDKRAEAAGEGPFSGVAVRAPEGAAGFGGGALERRSISEQVANSIMAMIKSGNLRPGDRLPTEAQMGIAFGISRPPLREALKALTLMRILESRQGGRYTVTELSPSRLIAPFNIILASADYNVHEHFEARAVVDCELVRLCAGRAPREVRQRILKLAVDGRAFLDDPVAFRLLDLEFHQSIYRAAGNRLLATLAEALYDVGLDLRRSASTVQGVIAKSVRQHMKRRRPPSPATRPPQSRRTAATSSTSATPRSRPCQKRRSSNRSGPRVSHGLADLENSSCAPVGELKAKQTCVH
jgi:GntR family transcriptional repressor for pyruvate dehydrogenase complex